MIKIMAIRNGNYKTLSTVVKSALAFGSGLPRRRPPRNDATFSLDSLRPYRYRDSSPIQTQYSNNKYKFSEIIAIHQAHLLPP
jgi:hypothetical protein